MGHSNMKLAQEQNRMTSNFGFNETNDHDLLKFGFFFFTNLNLKFIFADIMEVQILFDRHHGNEKFIFSLYDIALAPQKKSVNQRRKKV